MRKTAFLQRLFFLTGVRFATNPNRDSELREFPRRVPSESIRVPQDVAESIKCGDVWRSNTHTHTSAVYPNRTRDGRETCAFRDEKAANQGREPRPPRSAARARLAADTLGPSRLRQPRLARLVEQPLAEPLLVLLLARKTPNSRGRRARRRRDTHATPSGRRQSISTSRPPPFPFFAAAKPSSPF